MAKPAKKPAKAKPAATPKPDTFDFDVIVIGGGVAGTAAANEAARLGGKVAIVENNRIGGGCLATDAFPSKTWLEMLRRQRFEVADTYRQHNIDSYLARVGSIVESSIEDERRKLVRSGVTTIIGQASFTDPHTVEINGQTVTAAKFIITTGSKPNRPGDITFNEHIIDSDGVFEMNELPRSMIIVGGGIVGVEYACLFASCNVQVTVIDRSAKLLGACEDLIATSLYHRMAMQLGVRFHFSDNVASCKVTPGKKGDRVTMKLDSGSTLVTDKVLYSIGRHGVTAGLNLEAADVKLTDRGSIEGINFAGQTSVPHIYAAGDVLNYAKDMEAFALTLASTGIIEARESARHAMNPDSKPPSKIDTPPVCIYTIPSIGYIGETEASMRAQKKAFISGRARFDEVAMGKIIGENSGVLQLVFDAETMALAGVHIIGIQATELVGIGQVMMKNNNTLEFIMDTVFGYPSLGALYKVAARDAQHQLDLMLEIEPEDVQITA